MLVGAPFDSSACAAIERGAGPTCEHGAVYLIFLSSTGGAYAWRKITPASSAERPPLQLHARFGAALAVLDAPRTGALAIAAAATGASFSLGAVYYLEVDVSGAIVKQMLIEPPPETVTEGARFGAALAAADWDRDGTAELLVGIPSASPPSFLIMLLPTEQGQHTLWRRVLPPEGAELANFAEALAVLPSNQSQAAFDLAVSGFLGPSHGAVHMLSLRPEGGRRRLQSDSQPCRLYLGGADTTSSRQPTLLFAYLTTTMLVATIVTIAGLVCWFAPKKKKKTVRFARQTPDMCRPSP
jgi:hypothetical protein